VPKRLGLSTANIIQLFQKTGKKPPPPQKTPRGNVWISISALLLGDGTWQARSYSIGSGKKPMSGYLKTLLRQWVLTALGEVRSILSLPDVDQTEELLGVCSGNLQEQGQGGIRQGRLTLPFPQRTNAFWCPPGAEGKKEQEACALTAARGIGIGHNLNPAPSRVLLHLMWPPRLACMPGGGELHRCLAPVLVRMRQLEQHKGQHNSRQSGQGVSIKKLTSPHWPPASR